MGLLSFFSAAALALISILPSGCRRESADPEKPASASDSGSSAFARIESSYLAHLDAAMADLDSMASLLNPQGGNGKADSAQVRARFLSAKGHFKAAEPVLAWAEGENHKYLNGPNILKVDEEDLTNIKVLQPSGFQVLEEILHGDAFATEEIRNHARMTRNRLQLLRANTDLKRYGDPHFLWMIREGILRVAFLGITGFDSPALENSLPEAARVYHSLYAMIEIQARRFQNKDLHREWLAALQKAAEALQGDFREFDRYGFIREHTHAQIRLWNRTVSDWNIEFPVETALANRFASPFSREAFNMVYFSDPKAPTSTPEKILLGKRLFHDVRLSAPGRNLSCASCHIETKGFADNARTSFGLGRNSPTLAYAALQNDFFHDSRAGSLEGQIVSVVEAELEFHTDLEKMEKAIRADGSYAAGFGAIYQDTITEANIRNAIADYVRSLVPFTSRFDKNMRGEENTLTAPEIRGFNLFMGKGKCATCHFPPVFNGTIPPAYTDTELEHIGVPSAPVTRRASISPDLGRFHVFRTENRKHFFKTPTVRNVEKTFPYMHNGIYDSLIQVVDFYNRGGGIGIGISGPETEFQTLPPDTLGLTGEEMRDMVDFMKTLTDAPVP